MQRYFFSLRIALLVIVAGVAVSAIDLATRGFVVVYDPHALIAGAVLEDGLGARRRPLRAFARDYWATRPAFDGKVRLLCRSGREVLRADVMPGEQTSYTVAAEDCRRGR
ncbi:hypothetical protein K7957_16235 [Sphingomonas yunnanensis]|uniref:hypothetical protein n=1 Tax=Sphingomonas yunnanensis TaxID=310400 RepID=UPI001CA64869|nr:hypothetical protein [Sphingomonas yunnanensis]MBY9064488.1 hypothetical protein [Sphingomonas yunnanensis]